MKIRHFALVVAVSSALASPLVMAESVRAGGLSARHSFTTDLTRTTGSGKTLSRHTAQVATDTGFRRDTRVTNPQGKTASRTVEASVDADAGIRTRSVEGIRMNGDTYSGERITERTEDGYNRVVSRTNAAGETASKEVSTRIDRANNTLTKNVSATGFNGETHTATVVKTWDHGDAE